MNATTTEATTIKFSEVCGSVYDVTITAHAAKMAKMWAREDTAVTPHINDICASARGAYSDRVLAAVPDVSVTLGGDVLYVPEADRDGVSATLSDIWRDVNFDLFLKVRRIIDEAKAA